VPQGAVVLPPDQAALWEQYRQLGTPQELSTLREEAPRLREQVSTYERDQTLQRVAEVSKLNLAPLKRVGRDLTYVFEEVADADAQGGKRQEVFVEVEDPNTKAKSKVAVLDYAQREWQDLLPALQANANSNGQGSGGYFPSQPGQGAGGPQESVVQSYTRSAYGKLPGQS
jgi:hypothetical protein